MMSPSKVSGYKQNGTGRDTYIYQNNGGMYRKGLQNQSPSRSTYQLGAMTERTRRYLPIGQVSTSPDKRVKYQPNGTGRDLYIGATTNKQFSHNEYSRYNHIADLRNYGARKELRRSDYFTQVQFKKSQKELQQEQYVFNYQKTQCSQLSKPKKLNLPKLDMSKVSLSGGGSQGFLSPQLSSKNQLHKKNQSTVFGGKKKDKYEQYYDEIQRRIVTEAQ